MKGQDRIMVGYSSMLPIKVVLKIQSCLLACLLALFLCISTETHAANKGRVVVVDTVEHHSNHQLTEAFLAVCSVCENVQLMHMQQSRQQGREIALKLMELEELGNLDLALAIGPPAAEIVSRALKNTPIIYTMVPEKLLQLQEHEHAYALPVDPPLNIQMQALIATLPQVSSVGLILSEQTPWKQHPFDKQRLPEKLRLYEIKGAKEMPEALRKASNENNALIFMRDPMVLNRDSVKYIIEYTMKKLVYSFTYSNTLVELGMGMALVPDPKSFGSRAAHIANKVLIGEPVEVPPLTIADFDLNVNEQALSKIQNSDIRRLSENGVN